MKALIAVLLLSLTQLYATPMTGARFGIGEGSEIRDLRTTPTGILVACGQLGAAASPPKTTLHKLLAGDHQKGSRGFVAAFAPDLSTCIWFALFPADTIAPKQLAIGTDGSIAIGGKHLGGLAEQDTKTENWGKSDGALAKLNAAGTKVLWVSPGGPNQGEVTGLAMGRDGHVYFTAGSKVRSAANYLLRKNGTTGANENWAKSGKDGTESWCVYLHTNQEPLKREGQFLAFYDKAKTHNEEGHGYDYDGKGGWGPVRWSLKGFRVGGNVLALPDGDLIVSSCLQYDFRAAKRTEEGLKKGKSFPAFDYFLARYSPEGELRWSTNLYQPGDSVHTPDQKPIDLAYDKNEDRIYSLVKQHGSNVYRFKGSLNGDTGNLMISWIGKVDAKTGALEEGWYFQNNRLGNYAGSGEPASPPYPKLAGNALRRVAVASGHVFTAGRGGPKMWTSPSALQAWPEAKDGGGVGALLRLDTGLTRSSYATCLFADSPNGFDPFGLVVGRMGIVMAGRGQFGGKLGNTLKIAPWSEAGEGAGCAILRFGR